MADQTLQETTQNRDKPWRFLEIAGFLLFGVASLISPGITLYLRWLPWLTLLSILILVSLLVAVAIRRSAWWRQLLWPGLLVLGLGLYFGSLSYQAGSPARDARYLAWATPSLPNSPGNRTLAIAFPRLVPLEAPDKLGRPLSVYLWPPGQVLTPTQAISYTVAFVPYDDGLLFTNEKGVPVAPQVLVRSDQPPDKPGVLYVRRAPTSTIPDFMPITVQVYGPDGNPQELARLDFRLEDTYGAWWRHFADLILGPALLATFAGFVGLGWQQWQRERKRKQDRLDEIKKVEILVSQGELEEAKQKLAALALYTLKPELLLAKISQLESLLNQKKSEEARQKLAEQTVYTSDSEFQDGLAKVLELLYRTKINQIEEKRKQEYLTRMRRIRQLVITDKDEAQCQYQGLEGIKKDEAWTDLELITSLAETRIAVGVQPFEWPNPFADNGQQVDVPAITAWSKDSGVDLSFNPFGSGRAETEPFLREFFVRPPGWEQMKASEPTIVFGADGSGRTASCLLLAHTCQTTTLGPSRLTGQIDTFPVHLILFLDGIVDQTAVTLWRVLTRALAQATLAFLALNPQTFARTPIEQQRALARLFTMHRHYWGDLGEYLKGMGLVEEIAVVLADNVRRVGRGTRPPRPTDEFDLVTTLAEARLFPFQQSYLLAEVISTSDLPENITQRLATLISIIRSLAAQRLYLKLFIPADLKRFLEPLPPQVKAVELAWDESTLGEMIERRVQQAQPAKQTGAPSFKALFHHPKGDPAALLVETALESEGPPRRLIQLGQALLAENIRLIEEERQRGQKLHIPEAKLRREALQNVLKQAASETAS